MADPGKSSPAQEPAETAEYTAGELESELAEARRRAEEYLNDLRRVAADFDNYRKRVARDSEAQVQRAAESIVADLLPVLDNLERAVDASEHHEEAQVAEGVSRVRAQLADLLRRRGLEEIEAEPGELFDPHMHEALAHQPSEHAEGTIFTAYEGRKCVGRITAQIDREHLDRHKDQTGFFRRELFEAALQTCKRTLL